MIVIQSIAHDSTFPGRGIIKQLYASPIAAKQSMICLVIGTSLDAAALMSSFDQFKQYTTFLLLWMKLPKQIIKYMYRTNCQVTALNTAMKD